jgi:hypothetical protein
VIRQAKALRIISQPRWTREAGIRSDSDRPQATLRRRAALREDGATGFDGKKCGGSYGKGYPLVAALERVARSLNEHRRDPRQTIQECADRINQSIAAGGDGGIRTLDRALQPYNGLANRRLQPLGHISGRNARRDICPTHPPIASVRRRSLAGLRADCHSVESDL